MSIISTLMTENYYLWNGNEKLLGQYSGASTVKMMEDTMNVVEVLPDKFADPRVFGNSFVAAIFSFVVRSWALDATVIDERPGDVRDFRLKNKSDVFVENSNC